MSSVRDTEAAEVVEEGVVWVGTAANSRGGWSDMSVRSGRLVCEHSLVYDGRLDRLINKHGSVHDGRLGNKLIRKNRLVADWCRW